MEHRDSDAVAPHSPHYQSKIPLRQIEEVEKDTKYKDEMRREGGIVSGESAPRELPRYERVNKVTPSYSTGYVQQQKKDDVEIRGTLPTVDVSPSAVAAITRDCTSSFVSATAPSPPTVLLETDPLATVVISPPLAGQRGACRSTRPIDRLSASDSEHVDLHEHLWPSSPTSISFSDGNADFPFGAVNDAVLGTDPCLAPFRRRSARLKPPYSQATPSSHLSSARPAPADGMRTSVGSHNTRWSSKQSTASRRRYVPGRAPRSHSCALASDGGAGVPSALLNTTSWTTTQVSQVTTRAPNESPQGFDTSDTRVSLLSLTSEADSTSECTRLTPMRQRDESVTRRSSLPLPPPMRTSAFTLPGSTAHSSPATSMHTSTRPALPAPTASTPSLMEPRPLTNHLILRNPFTQQRQLSDGRLGGHGVVPFQSSDVDTPATAVSPVARHRGARSPLLRVFAGAGQSASRTPPVAVLVPLPREPTTPEPTPALASPPPIQQLESDTNEVNANSFSAEMSFRCQEPPSSDPQEAEPSSTQEPRRSAVVSPLHPSLSQVYLAAPKPRPLRPMPTCSSPLRHGDPTLLEYVAGLKSPRGSSSIRGALLCAGVALCAVPLCATLLLLFLHYWAVALQEKSYPAAALRPHVGTISTVSLTLLLGILLAFVVMGGGSGAALYVMVYRLSIRYHLRAFALCVRLADGLSPLDIHHLAAEAAEEAEAQCDSAMPSDAAAAAAQQPASGAAASHGFPSFVARWHEEVSRLVVNLTCPIEVSQAEWRSFLALERRSLVLPNEGTNGCADHPEIAAVPADGPFGNSNNSRLLPFCVQSPALPAESEPWSPRATQRGSRYRVNEAVFSRRPQHPVDVSKRQEAVTVVVCRFLTPTELLVQQSPLTRWQLKELQHLSNEFHQRLRAIPRKSYAAITEVGVSEVVFSFNTVSPLPSLVASPAAVALAVAAHRALAEWRPAFLGTLVQWGIAVHRFDAYMCPTRGMQGRLYLSFGTVEYDFARLLADLAALFDYGALCHAGFLADASCKWRTLPVDYVMDLRQQALLVYQLHDREVDRVVRLQMKSAIAAMRNGDYRAAADALGAWERKRGGLPRVAAHLQYVASFLERAALQRRTRPSERNAAPVSSPPFIHAIEGVAEWAVESLLLSYSRPPPVWEEEEAPAAMAPRMSSPDRLGAPSIVAGSEGRGCSLRTQDNGSSNVIVPPSPLESRGTATELATFLRALMHRPYPARALYISPTQQQLGQLGPMVIEKLPHQACEASATIVGAAGPLSSPHGSDAPLSRGTEPAPRGDHVPEAGSPPLSPRDNITGGSFWSHATHSISEVLTPAAALPDITSEDRMLAAFTLLTEPDQSTVTMTAARPRLFSNSWSLAESGVPEMPTLTPLNSGVLRPSQCEVRRQRHTSILLPAAKSEEDATTLAAVCASAKGSSAVRSSRGRRDSGGSKCDQARGRTGSQLAMEAPASDEGFPRQLVHRASSQSTDTTFARFPSEVSHDSVSARSGSPRRRTSASTAAASSVLPLFANKVPFTVDRAEARSEADFASEADLNQELSLMSVAQRSRSRLSQRATAPPSSVVCSRTKRIDSGSSDAVTVFQGFHPNGYLVAVKRANRLAAKQVALLRNEVDLLRELNHRNIVNIVSAWKDSEAEYLAMEYACETLSSVLQKFKVLLPGVVRFYARELLNALVYLHRDCGIIHRDLSPNNVIITNTTDRSRVKLIDFGRSVVDPHLRSCSGGFSVTVPGSANLEVTERRSSRSMISVAEVTMSVVGTPFFMSPQACQGLVHPLNDIWSLGIIVHLCLTGTYPYPTAAFTDPETFIENVGSGRLTPVLAETCEMTGEARCFIEQCLSLSHTERPSAEALLKHSFVER
ncbi:hypothetical protein LSCM4_01507 [Leishmania orientalis]|uniref:Protein kinase domain-containing protein n=1 Tax=Leishmania orientalis TaxID=2249476 RepID=A0A836KBN8_9TRYP|nr:hypothetical protein LSCM4_01507 [Leishmania orientalis]